MQGYALCTALTFYGGFMKRFRSLKYLLFIIYIIIVYSLCGCSTPVNYEGKAMVDKAAALHTEKESATVVVTDNLTGKAVQRIEYRFVGDVMQYMYTGEMDGKTYYEFNNGTELNFITIPDESEWSFTSKGNEDYYNYSRASRHYFADGAQLFNDYEAAVSESLVRQFYDVDVVTLKYDLGKLSSYSSLASYGSFTEFLVEFNIDRETGECKRIRNKFTTESGETSDYIVILLPREASAEIKRVEITQ